MTDYTAPPDQTGLVLNEDNLIVHMGGTATDTTVNVGYVGVGPGGTATDTTINAGGHEHLEGAIVYHPGGVTFYAGVAIDTTINRGGTLDVATLGQANHTIINGGGFEVVMSQAQDHHAIATDTIINDNGELLVTNGGLNRDTTINAGGLESVRGGGTATDTTINAGGVESVEIGGTADNVIFGPDATPHATLELSTPSGLKGTITNWQVGDVIDFLNTDVTSFKVTGKTLTVNYDGFLTASYTLSSHLPPDTMFKLKSVPNGTDLILVGLVGVHHHHEAAIHFGHEPQR
jgi:autotransporter passenger strand-loop-strand repeat protein